LVQHPRYSSACPPSHFASLPDVGSFPDLKGRTRMPKVNSSFSLFPSNVPSPCVGADLPVPIFFSTKSFFLSAPEPFPFREAVFSASAKVSLQAFGVALLFLFYLLFCPLESHQPDFSVFKVFFFTSFPFCFPRGPLCFSQNTPDDSQNPPPFFPPTPHRLHFFEKDPGRSPQALHPQIGGGRLGSLIFQSLGLGKSLNRFLCFLSGGARQGPRFLIFIRLESALLFQRLSFARLRPFSPPSVFPLPSSSPSPPPVLFPAPLLFAPPPFPETKLMPFFLVPPTALGRRFFGWIVPAPTHSVEFFEARATRTVVFSRSFYFLFFRLLPLSLFRQPERAAS